MCYGLIFSDGSLSGVCSGDAAGTVWQGALRTPAFCSSEAFPGLRLTRVYRSAVTEIWL